MKVNETRDYFDVAIFYALDEHQTTIKYQLILIKKIDDMDAEYGEERWTTLRIDPYSDYDIRNVPIES